MSYLRRCCTGRGESGQGERLDSGVGWNGTVHGLRFSGLLYLKDSLVLFFQNA